MARDKLYTIGVIMTLSSCCFALLASGQTSITDPQEVSALRAVRSKLKDPYKYLNNWKKKDPCADKWNGVICYSSESSDGYLHVGELRLLNMNLTGTLSPELGKLSNLTILDFMWNNISGSIPKEIGKLAFLQLLLLSGNLISGPLPDELGSLPSLVKFQLDVNYISGQIPISFAKLPNVKHFHMNNNSISGQIPPELALLPKLQHILLDNNKLSGHLPPELSAMPSLKILQLDNNDFSGTVIPQSYGNMSKLLKLSLRNCSLQGTIPDLSGVPRLFYLDLSMNKLTGSIPTNKLSNDITTIDLSNNTLNGSIPSNFSGLPLLQNLNLSNNLLSGSVPTAIWQNITFSPTAKLFVDFENNLLSDISGSLNPPANVTIKLGGNSVCTSGTQQNILQFCGITENGIIEAPQSTNNSDVTCLPQSCPTSDHFEYITSPPDKCFCALPFGVGLRLRSPSILYFTPYTDQFISYMTSNLSLKPYQLHIDSITWEKGPRLRMYLKFFPIYSNTTGTFNESELQRIAYMFASFSITGDDLFGPYDLLYFTLVGPYSNVFLRMPKNGMSKGVIAGIVLGTISCAITAVLAFTLVFLKWKRRRSQRKVSKDQSHTKLQLKMEGVKNFSFKELETATNSFSRTAQIGEGGYGKVYKSILADGSVVAIKRAHQGSLQCEKEFYTEIELLSRVHHRNLVSLVGYCDEESEQMLVYEYMPNGSLQDLLSGRYRGTLNFGTRLHIALGASKGILYLHSEADPPIYHRDIKANNILLDSKFTAKVSDFGISRLAPVPDDKGVSAPHISTGVKGTLGYVDPEYFLTHKCTDKSDVYSLGIVFLELLTGMQPISHGRNIVREVNAACQSGMMFSIIDRNMGVYRSECVKKFMALALRCSLDEMKARPSMSEVVRELEDIDSMLPEPNRIVSLELEESTFPKSGSATSSSVYSRRNSYVSMDASGSNLVSGVIPTIHPR